MNGESERAPVVFSGHLDTVHPVGSFGSPAVRLQDGKIYGPGVADCKGGIVASLLAMHALRDVGVSYDSVKLKDSLDGGRGERRIDSRTSKDISTSSGNHSAYKGTGKLT